MSKGSERRPARITSEQFESNWERIFRPHGHKFKIYLDDARDLPDHFVKEGGWVIARTPPEFYALIEDGLENVEAISFDNDLGAGWVEGYDLLCRIEWLVRSKGQPCPPRLMAHTQNPAAMKKMHDCIVALNRYAEQHQTT